MTDYRTQLRADWPPERISAMLEELAGAETLRSFDVTCKHCRKTGNYKLNVSDAKVRLAALQYAADHGYGKAAQAKENEAKPIDTGIDPTKLNPNDRKALIQQLRARVTTSTTEHPGSDLSPDPVS